MTACADCNPTGYTRAEIDGGHDDDLAAAGDEYRDRLEVTC